MLGSVDFNLYIYRGLLIRYTILLPKYGFLLGSSNDFFVICRNYKRNVLKNSSNSNFSSNNATSHTYAISYIWNFSLFIVQHNQRQYLKY